MSGLYYIMKVKKTNNKYMRLVENGSVVMKHIYWHLKIILYSIVLMVICLNSNVRVYLSKVHIVIFTRKLKVLLDVKIVMMVIVNMRMEPHCIKTQLDYLKRWWKILNVKLYAINLLRKHSRITTMLL
jgi:hypothetical protein